MFISDLTKYELDQFKLYNRRTNCPICNEQITAADGFEMIKIRYGRNTTYHFIHTNCLLNNYFKEIRKYG